MIAWSIEAAHQSNCFDRVIVSTDDEEIARIASDRGAEVPFLRPARLSDDQASTQAVILHALEWIQQQGQACDALCCLYATAPFVQPDDMHQSQQLLIESRPERLCSPQRHSRFQFSARFIWMHRVMHPCFNRSASAVGVRI